VGHRDCALPSSPVIGSPPPPIVLSLRSGSLRPVIGFPPSPMLGSHSPFALSAPLSLSAPISATILGSLSSISLSLSSISLALCLPVISISYIIARSLSTEVIVVHGFAFLPTFAALWTIFHTASGVGSVVPPSQVYSFSTSMSRIMVTITAATILALFNTPVGISVRTDSIALLIAPANCRASPS
jgi:hypothetical protein